MLTLVVSSQIFYPTLTVGRTMDFATRLKNPTTLPENAGSAEQHRIRMKEFLLESMGISHTADTKVGDAFVRGVSGGERKRVSIIETLASQGSTSDTTIISILACTDSVLRRLLLGQLHTWS